MNFYVIKLKHIIIALLIFAVIPIIWFTTSRAVSVFNVNGREIPIYSVERDDNKIALTFDCAWNDARRHFSLWAIGQKSIPKV